MVTADTKRRFLLVGNGPYANRGCEAIVRGTVEILSARFPCASFTVINIGDTAGADTCAESDGRIAHRLHGWPQRLSRDWWSYRFHYRFQHGSKEQILGSDHPTELLAMREAVCALQSGGDNYSLDYGPPTTHMRLDDALLLSRKPLVLWGASVGPFTKDPEMEQTMQSHLQKFTAILARESETVAYLSSIGIEENVRLVADPAFCMQPEEPDLPDKMRAFLDDSPIGLNFSPLAGKFHSGTGSWPDLVRECIGKLAESGFGRVLLVPHVFVPGGNDYDLMLESALDLDGWGDRITILPPTLSATEYKWAMSRCRAFAGARTHATIAALSSQVPTVSLGYSMKARGINKDVYGHLDWLLPVDSLTPESLTAKIGNLLDRESEVRESLTSASPAMVSRARKAADHLAAIIDNGTRH